MEFMAAGRAIVATAVGGVPEILEDGRSGVLVPPGDVGELARSVERLAADPARREELGRNAAARQRELFDLDRNVRRLEEIYEQLAARARESGSRRAGCRPALVSGEAS
jgi:glycosyltransferase involved in cell wall biosynthesis